MKQFLTVTQEFNQLTQDYKFNIPNYSKLLDININQQITLLIETNSNQEHQNEKIVYIKLYKDQISYYQKQLPLNTIPQEYNYFKTINLNHNMVIPNESGVNLNIITKTYYIFYLIEPSTQEIRNTIIDKII